MKESTGGGSGEPVSSEAPGFGLERSRAATPRQSLLLALSGAGAPTESLQRARALADGLGAALHVVRVLPEEERSPSSAANKFPELLRSVERTLRAHRETRAWMSQALPGRGVERFAILHGELVERVAVYAREADAKLILIGAEDDQGAVVTRLVATTGVPVLVSRTPAKNHTIVAATDLRHPDYPVLQFAALLGRQLESHVIAVHNLGLAAPLQQARAEGSGAAPAARAHAEQLDRLRQVSEQFQPSIRAVVRQESDPVDAILEQASAEEADLVVVGARARAWFEGSGRDGLAGTVIHRARRSVLVIPVGDTSEPAAELAWD